MRRRVVVIAALFLLAVAWWAWRRPPASHEERIRAVVQRAIVAAEARDLGGLLEPVSERFNSRGMDRQGLRGMLFVQLRRGSWRRVFAREIAVALENEGDPYAAKVTFEALLASGDAVELQKVKRIEDLLPKDVAVYHFELDFAREADDIWRVIAADYRSAPWP